MTVDLQSSLSETAILPESVGDILGDPLLKARDRLQRGAHIGRRHWLIARVLQFADVLGFAIAFSVAQDLFGEGGGRTIARALLLTVPLWIVVAKLYGLYDRDQQRNGHSTVDDLASIFHMTMIGAWLAFTVSWAAGLSDPTVWEIAFFWLLSICLITLGRGLGRIAAHRSPAFSQTAVIVGAGDVGQDVARKLRHHPEYGVEVVGFLDAEPKVREPGLDDLRMLGEPAQVREIVRAQRIDRVVVAFSRDSHQDLVDLIRSLKGLDVQVDIVPRLFEVLGPDTHLHTAEGVPLVGLRPLTLSRTSRVLKRVMDLVGASVGLVLFAPVFAVIALLIKRDSGGPVFFRQVRVGCCGRTFEILKFRTMVADAEARKSDVGSLNMHARNGGDPRMFKIPDDPRCTKIGRLLRAYSLDELPQLINVARGEMSLVGPRPLILDEDRYVEDWARCRLDLKPGVTGPWQALGASTIPFGEMVRLDYVYVSQWSLFNDFKWLWRTVPCVLRSHPRS
jgi:exopolysaccharide biosynthesis polyprenyl glycosylphosphotransferase